MPRCPGYIADLVTPTSSLRAQGSCALGQETAACKFSYRALSHAGRAAWNNLPSSITATVDTDTNNSTVRLNFMTDISSCVTIQTRGNDGCERRQHRRPLVGVLHRLGRFVETTSADIDSFHLVDSVFTETTSLTKGTGCWCSGAPSPTLPLRHPSPPCLFNI